MNYVNHDKVETLKVYKPFTAYFIFLFYIYMCRNSSASAKYHQDNKKDYKK